MRRSIYTERIIFEADPDLKAEIDSYAGKEKVTRAEALRRLIKIGLRDG